MLILRTCPKITPEFELFFPWEIWSKVGSCFWTPPYKILYDPYRSTPHNYVKATFVQNGFFDRDKRKWERISRLLDPVWAIEYAAANMEWATRQTDPDFSRPWPHHSQNRNLTPWEKMASWYNLGYYGVASPYLRVLSLPLTTAGVSHN